LVAATVRHSRVWNRRFTIMMRLPRRPEPIAESINPQAGRAIYNTLVVLVWLVARINSESGWCQKVMAQLRSCQHANLYTMGFPAHWRETPVWSTSA
jgi:abortive infection bacteriophage resistance protein